MLHSSNKNINELNSVNSSPQDLDPNRLSPTDETNFQNQLFNSPPILNSAFTEKTAQQFSGFKTPFINTSRWNYIDKLGDVYDIKNFIDDDNELLAEKRIFDSNSFFDPYPAWNQGDDVPISQQKIEKIFIRLSDMFGFQKDNTKNMFDYLMKLLDSRASRFGPGHSLRSLHADYIGGVNANYRKWYFACQMDIDDLLNANLDPNNNNNNISISLQESQERWSQVMNSFLAEDCIIQLALYLLCWGEANNVRFMPECICFIFKCCTDLFYSLNLTKEIQNIIPSFLDSVITPLYKYYRDQSYELINNKWIHKDKDHSKIIGYDDMNQLFWYRKSLDKIILKDSKKKLMDIPNYERLLYLDKIDWNKVFIKTYYERRTWLHTIINFNRIWIIHIGLFWYYICFNSQMIYTFNYQSNINNKPSITSTLSSLSIGGSLSCLINLFCLLLEFLFVPRKFIGSNPIFLRLLFMIFLFLLNLLPSIYIFLFSNINDNEDYLSTLILSICQFLISIGTFIYLSIIPLANLIGNSHCSGDNRKYLATYFFTNSFYKLKGKSKICSYSLWTGVFLSKAIESYFFLAINIKDSIRELYLMKLNKCAGDYLIGTILCKNQAKIVLILLLITNSILFLLDTYLWYVIWNTGFSICRSFYFGVSIWTPWRNMFIRLPKRILSKLISQSDINIKNNLNHNFKKKIVSQIWNSIVISMYREHLISLEHLQQLIYQQILKNGSSPNSETNLNEIILTEPCFFLNQEDGGGVGDLLLDSKSEASRRLTFFAQSLSTPIPSSCPIEQMPSFSVLIPHFSEKIALSLKEIIRKQDEYSNITLLEYLKLLHPDEWSNFVKDTKLLCEEEEQEKENISISSSSTFKKKNQFDDLPLFQVGFKTATPEYVLRTRIWASLRSQTLYRTISGFMNYSRALKLLYDVEHQSILPSSKSSQSSPLKLNHMEEDNNKLEAANNLSQRKFRLVVSLQRLKFFTPEQEENCELLLRTYPELQIAYLDFETDENSHELIYYSCLIDGNCDIMDNGKRKPKYKIKLSGNPILGDGKSDNQNHSLIFTRGEYLQLIDANQDNYLEECIKIRNILSEFEENKIFLNPYGENDNKFNDLIGIENNGLNKEDKRKFNKKNSHRHNNNNDSNNNKNLNDKNQNSFYYTYYNNSGNNNDNNYVKNPVAIIGTREYIFSENIGVLGDVAAGKEQTFGTLFARTLAQIGGKLHYGHPDFLNVIFMSTRGGISKSQKGLHLNEDIYAGMNAILRGGRIKHCEYMQCGKGRDLGFTSILNFTKKIGAGMGEQILSREYFYLGTQLPFDRFLSFFYAHPGFHLNNFFILLSIRLCMIFSLNLAVLTNSSIICEYDKNRPITDLHKPLGCNNLIPIINWIQRCIFSIFIVFLISLLPLSIQELMERGILKCFTRILKHFISFSPLFEIFVCRIYSKSLTNNLSIGGAKYITTGRNISTTRNSFPFLYSRFSNESIYFASISFLMILYCSLVMWKLSFLYFCFVIISLALSPFIFNPNQFQIDEFLLDYKLFWNWLLLINSKLKTDSWISNIRNNRMQLTGSKRRILKRDPNEIDVELMIDYNKPSFIGIITTQILSNLILVLITSIAFLFANSQNEPSISSILNKNNQSIELASNSILRLLIVSIGPIIINSSILLIIFIISLILGPTLTYIIPKFPSILRCLIHFLCLLIHILFFQFLWFAQNWNIPNTILGFCCSILIQNLIFKILTIGFLSREFKQDKSNKSWWSGKWIKSGLGWYILTQPLREFICKIIEMSYFSADFILIHFLMLIQFPLLFIPYISVIHSTLLLWVKPQFQLSRPIFAPTRKRNRRITVNIFAFLFLFNILLLIILIIGPNLFINYFEIDLEQFLPDLILDLLQPIESVNNMKGLKNYNPPKTHA